MLGSESLPLLIVDFAHFSRYIKLLRALSNWFDFSTSTSFLALHNIPAKMNLQSKAWQIILNNIETNLNGFLRRLWEGCDETEQMENYLVVLLCFMIRMKTAAGAKIEPNKNMEVLRHFSNKSQLLYQVSNMLLRAGFLIQLILCTIHYLYYTTLPIKPNLNNSHQLRAAYN